MRRPKSCGWIDVAAGFPVSISGAVCAECSKRGVQTLEAQLYRQGVVNLALTHVTVHGSPSPLVREVMAARGTAVRDRPLNLTHWPFPHWRGWLNAWEGIPYPVAVGRGVWAPTVRAWRDLAARWKGEQVRSCGRCGCWVPAKRAVLFLMGMVRPLPAGRRR